MKTPLLHAAAVSLALALPACGGAVQSGVAVGRVAQGLSSHARSAPQQAEVCALQEALAALPGNEKPIAEGCTKAAKSDLLWRRSLGVLSAYGQTLQTLASGGSTDGAGKLEAALTGISGNDWIQVEGASEQASRDAAAALVKQMADSTAGGDLSRAIKDAGPHVKTLCEGLTTALETAAKGFADVQKDAEKKRASRADRRCGSVNGANICVGESPVDRMVYANVFAQGALMESGHLEARDAVASFCAAHRKLESAAADGNLSKEQTYTDIVAAVKGAQHAAPASDAKPAGKSPKK